MKLNLIKHSIVQSLSVICLLLGTNSYANLTNGNATFHCPDGNYSVAPDPDDAPYYTFTDENGIEWQTSDGAVAAEGNIDFSQYTFISADTDLSGGVTCVVQFNYANNTLISPVDDTYKHATASSDNFTNGECTDGYTECIFQTQS